MSKSTVPLQSSLPLQGERVAFTGTLASMTHAQAAKIVEQNGGAATQNVSRQTSMLVVGEEGWPLDDQGQPSIKLNQALELIEVGSFIRVLRESEWLRLLDLEHSDREVNRLHTPAMLQQLLGIPASTVRRWERLGLIHAVQRVYRLPYFDFQQVAGVRKLHELLSAGVSPQQIESSLARLERIYSAVDQPLTQIEILAQDSRLVVRDRVGLVEARSGQRLLEFDQTAQAPVPVDLTNDELGDTNDGVDPTIEFVGIAEASDGHSNWSSADWFEQGCRLLDQDVVDGAIEALRMAVMDCPDDPEMQFHLADALVRNDNLAGALERYYMTVALDREYVEAWTQLGCVHHLLGDSQSAIEAFDIALATHREYSVAMYHKACVLLDQNQRDAATELFSDYLQREDSGPWAEHAREVLGLAAFHSV